MVQFWFRYMTSLPRGDHAAGAQREVYEFGTGIYKGSIPEAPHTYALQLQKLQWVNCVGTVSNTMVVRLEQVQCDWQHERTRSGDW